MAINTIKTLLHTNMRNVKLSGNNSRRFKKRKHRFRRRSGWISRHNNEGKWWKMEEEWKRLSEKEFQIMTYMWEENHPLTMNEIREKIGTQGKPANVSTTGSQIRGLIEKGFISQSGHRGQMARYMASVSKEAYYKWELHEFRKRWNLTSVLRVI